MNNQEKIAPLLQDLVKDNPTYKFPIEHISKELTNMFMEPEEFDYFMIQSYRSLKREYGGTVAHIFLTTMENKLNMDEKNIRNLTLEQYQERLEEFFNTLENLYITRIEKNTSDGEMLSAMI